MKIFRSIEEREAFDAIADKKEREAFDTIADEFVKHTIIDRLFAVEKINFFKDEIKRQQEVIARSKGIIESCFMSFFDGINNANDRLKLISSRDIYSKFEDEGVNGVKFYVEEVRRLLFDDEHCEDLKKYNFIGIDVDYDVFAAHENICYHFSDGKVTFAVKIPRTASVHQLVNRYLRGENLEWNPFDYGKISLAGIDDGKDYTFFKTYSIVKFRMKLAELAKVSFKDAWSNKGPDFHEDHIEDD